MSTSLEPSSIGSSSSNGIVKGLQSAYGIDLMNEIIHSKILVIGAGGIGCEIIKNLALTGFRNITIVDLDTIDISNLNRQLLFRTHHVGQSKCQVACTVAKTLSIFANTATPTDDTTSTNNDNGINYNSIYGNVCDTNLFHFDTIKNQKYNVILNALDNVIARRRMNRICITTSIPCIEAGTTGYLGQVSTIHSPSNTACYECVTQETQKVYPICTIRSTPSTPVHCIVWSKELYKLLFDNTSTKAIEESMLYEATSSSSAKSEEHGVDGDGDGGSSTYMESVMEIRQLIQQQTSIHDAIQKKKIIEIGTNLIQNLYVDEIQKQLNMDRYKTAQKKPIPLSYDVVHAATVVATAGAQQNQDTDDEINIIPPSSKSTYRHTDIWTPAECVIEIISCLLDAAKATAEAISNNEENTSPPTSTILPTFDKDDIFCMRFITATCNLRMTIFGITPIQSVYSAKGIAGNIIPAIATTNAITAGCQTLQCIQIIKAQMEYKKSNPSYQDVNSELTSLRDYCSYINCLRNPTRNGLYITSAQLEPKNTQCYICSKAMIYIQLNTMKWTLQDFINKLCKDQFHFTTPSISYDHSGDCIWEEGDDADIDAFQMNLLKLLPNLPCGGIVHGTVLTIEDFTQDLSINIAISHVDQWDMNSDDIDPDSGQPIVPDDHKFIISGQNNSSTSNSTSVTTSTVASATTATATNDDDDDDIIEIVNTKAQYKTGYDEDEKERSNKRINDDKDDTTINYSTSNKKMKISDATTGNSNVAKNDDITNADIIEIDLD